MCPNIDSYIGNPALLKLALYCEGLKLSERAEEEVTKGREIVRTRAGLGSGLELVLPGGLWTNAPVTEQFCEDSPFTLDYVDGEFLIRDPFEHEVAVSIAPRPSWYDRVCSTGKTMRRIGTLQGTYLGIYPTQVCEFWQGADKEQCRYCSVGLNLGLDDAENKTLTEVLEVVKAAREESQITYVDFNTGHYEDQSYLDALEPLIRAVKEETGLLVGVQTPPHPDLSRYDRLREIGVNRVSFCFEIYDPERFAEVCPGKNRVYGLDRYLATMDYCASLGRKQRFSEPWVTNGEIIAGLEDPASTIAAIDRIVSVGAIPTVCVFRPLAGTAYEHLPPPRTLDMVAVFSHLYEACMGANLPIGVAPNIHVSLVMLPEECAGLSALSHSPAFAFKQARLNIKKVVYRNFFRFKLSRYRAS